MIPPSQPATRSPPNRGEIATTRPARISTPPTMYIASCALPGIRSLNSGARYFGQSLIMTSANLSSPNRIGATVNAMRSSMKAWATGSLRSTFEAGTGIGRRVAARALLMVLLLGSRLPTYRLSDASRAELTSAVRLAALEERAQALVVLVAGRAALQVGAQPWNPLVGRLALELELDVLVEPLEALVAENLRLGRSQQPLEGFVVHVPVHDRLR